MKTKKLILLFCLLCSMAVNNAFAYDIAVKNADGVTIYYNYINDGTELEVTYQKENDGLNSYSGSVVIPQEVTYDNKTLKVTSLGREAFRYCIELTSVTIPNSVTNIGFQCFRDCLKLPSITIPNSVTSLGDWVFLSCLSLTSANIPEGMTSIPKHTFSNCGSLTSVTIPNSVTTLETYAFSSCI